MEMIQPPDSLPVNRINGVVPNSIFLAGSIEMGKAENWQEDIEKLFSKKEGYIFNPRREDWDSNWEQRIDNPEFYEQVSWELTALDLCESIVMYYDPDTKSPISLLELGLYANTGKLFVCCPEGFWRKGNVDIVCERYNIPLCEDITDLVKKVKAYLGMKKVF